MAPARRLRDAAEPLAMHPVGSPWVRRKLEVLGLKRFPAYVGGRAAALRDPSAEDVVAAFAFFEPRTLAHAWTTARAACPLERMVVTRQTATVRSLRLVLDGEHVGPVATALHRAVAAAAAEELPLFAGLQRRPLEGDPVGRLWQACEALREHRGGTHVQACSRHGLDPVESNVLTELWWRLPLGTHTRTRGWSDAEISAAVWRLRQHGLVDGTALSQDGSALREAVERDTDDAQEPVLTALGSDLKPAIAALNRWSSRCIAAGTFTADPAKRATG